ncbi:MAG: hypothetical protein DPW16_19395 [Chloroflexi bacterium]|nr:hypothetical protein [Chloroflexota bacterium]
MHLHCITIAVNNMEAMVQFYNHVFAANLTQAGSPLFYTGTLAGCKLFFCSNSIPQIKAEKNRQQFHFIVDDLETTLHQVRQNNGQVMDDATEEDGMKAIGIIDPDGNTIVLLERV